MAVAEVGKIIGNRYHVHRQLGGGGMGIVYHVTDSLTGNDVALKQVLIDAPHSFKLDDSDVDYRVALAHEFKTMASLRHPNIISVLDYGFDEDQQPYYTMELLADAQPLTLVAQSCDFTQQLHYLMQLLHALAYLHRRGVYHRDLKPDNVLVQDGTVRVLDFGLALVKNQTDPAQNATGTLAYMAPETLKGLPPTPATDLYAVGVMGYEIFVGRHPFNLNDVNILLQDVITTLPNFANTSIQADLMMILERLMLKNPQDRYQSAQDVIDVFNHIIEQPLNYTSSAIRESVLQTAEFVGRELELGQLTERLEQAINGTGQAILVGGESGVGKSRLLEELRILALVEGADVIRGHGTTEGGSPYALWRNVLRWLSMIHELNDLEASVLKPFIPDISQLIGHDVAEPPQLSPQATQARMITLLESLFERLPIDKPLVILLEDIHWAGSESLKALEHLTNHLQQVPVLIVASYRNDEAPTLPDTLNLPVIALQRLTDYEIRELSQAILGEVGQQKQVVDLLQQETEGNIFFVIEVMRALAEESGDFESIGTRTIPAQVFDGGLQTVINRRLEQIPTRMRLLMRLSAITGRQIDLDLLRILNDHLPNLQEVEIDEWLQTLSDAAIIIVIDNQWHFAHEKLRDGLIHTIQPSEMRTYHRRVAEAIETVYGDIPEYTATLAYHWRKAGDTNKELAYVVKSGEQMLDSGAYQEAIDFLKRALEIAGTSKLTPLTRAALMRKLSSAYVAMGNLSEGESILHDALALYGYPVPAEDNINIQLAQQFSKQLLHRVFPFVFMESKVEQDEELVEAAAAHEQLVELAYYTNKTTIGLYASLRTMNISELTKPSKHLGRAYGAISYVGMLAHNKIADLYYRKGLSVAQSYPDKLSAARTYQVSALRFVSRGEWEQAEAELEKALSIYDELGDLRFWTNGAQTLGEVYYFKGEFQRSIDMRKAVYQTSLRYGDIQAQGFGLRGQATNLLILGELDEAEQLAQSAISRYSASHDKVGEADAWGLLALANLRQERFRRARINVEQVIKLITQSTPTSYNSLIALYTTAETLLSLYERENGSQPKESNELQALIEPLLATFKTYTRRFMIGKPRYQLYWGRWLWLNGKSNKALKVWMNGTKVSENMKMPYDKALLQYEIGRRFSDMAQSKELLDEANQGFAQLGARYEIEKLEAI